MSIRLTAPILASLLCAAAAPAAAMSKLATEGKRVVENAQCTRCHGVTDIASATRGVSPAHRSLHCVDCHNWILDTRDDPRAIRKNRRRFPDWDRYLDNIVHFTAVPDLGTIARRIDPSFIRSYLDAPFDLRPFLDESMLHARLTDADKDAVAGYLAELSDGAVSRIPEGPVETPSAERVAAGRDRFENLSCPTCHVYGNVEISRDVDAAFYEAIKEVAKNAPNLRFVRDRIPRHILVRHILDPKSVDPLTRMPKQVVTEEDAEMLADFLLFGDAEAVEAKPRPRPTIPVLARRVKYDEVYDEVFGKICVHCHMNRTKNNGEGGPGNSGGLGFAAIELDLETYKGTKRGLVRDGKRVNILEPQADGSPPLMLESLLRRFDETSLDARNPILFVPPEKDYRPGMPLTLEPLTLAQLSLVKTWLEQGARGPRKLKLVVARNDGKRGKRGKRRRK